MYVCLFIRALHIVKEQGIATSCFQTTAALQFTMEGFLVRYVGLRIDAFVYVCSLRNLCSDTLHCTLYTKKVNRNSGLD